MSIFKYIKNLEPQIDDAFKEFYDTMLNDVRLGVFFEN